MEPGDPMEPDRKLKPIPTQGFFSRVSRLLRRRISDPSSAEGGPEKIPILTVEGDAEKENKDRRRDVNSLPPWIHSLEQGERIDEVDWSNPLLSTPPRIKPAQHNNAPADPKSVPRPKAGPGRVWNHARTKEAVTMPYHPEGHHARWQPFIRSSMLPRESNEGPSYLVDEDWVKEHYPDLETDWETATSEEQQGKGFWLFSPRRRADKRSRFERGLMRNAFVPLIARLTVLAFSVAALGIGVQIFKLSNALNTSKEYATGVNGTGQNEDAICKQQTSTYMAFIVNIIAFFYLIYITIDEYTAAPLGLRSSRTKMRLIFLDLIFIIFSAANLGLAFNTLTDQQWSCYIGTPSNVNNNNEEAARSTCVHSTTLCRRQIGLSAVLVAALLSWVATFAISVLRVIERVSR